VPLFYFERPNVVLGWVWISNDDTTVKNLRTIQHIKSTAAVMQWLGFEYYNGSCRGRMYQIIKEN
jgi:hypothetical protein